MHPPWIRGRVGDPYPVVGTVYNFDTRARRTERSLADIAQFNVVGRGEHLGARRFGQRKARNRLAAVLARRRGFRIVPFRWLCRDRRADGGVDFVYPHVGDGGVAGDLASIVLVCHD